MNDALPEVSADLHSRVRRELIDSFDEELELDDHGLHEAPDRADFRAVYFRGLFRLQGELVKLQDWIAATRQKAIILFEGRDAAGKGGVIKRIAQRLNPRICRTVALPAPNDRERTSGISSDTSRIFPPPARWSSSIAAGTTAPASSE